MAHGLPMSDWAADAMTTRTFNTTGISNRGLAILAGNSMHTMSAFCLRITGSINEVKVKSSHLDN